MQYDVQAVDDDELPEGRGWLVVERPDAPSVLLVGGALAECWRSLRTYEDTIEPCTVPTIMLPAYPELRAV